VHSPLAFKPPQIGASGHLFSRLLATNMSDKKKKKAAPEIVNRRATYEYHFLQRYEAGIALLGTEIKAYRAGNINLTDAYCLFSKGELFIQNLYIAEYENGTYSNHQPRRVRKLLLRGAELRKLERKASEKGLTIVPYRMYINDRGFVKLEIALAQGKKAFDKRESIKEKDNRREMDRYEKMR
jgi:SsrA-binding protein